MSLSRPCLLPRARCVRRTRAGPKGERLRRAAGALAKLFTAVREHYLSSARARARAGGPGEPLMPTCRDCSHFDDDPASLERRLPGLTALSSAYSSVRGDAGICQASGRYLLPLDAAGCPDFRRRGADQPMPDQ